MFLAFIMDMLVWSKAGRIDMNPSEGVPPPRAAPLPPEALLPPDALLPSDAHQTPSDTQL